MEQAIQVDEKPSGVETQQIERRAHPRHAVDADAMLLLLHHGSHMPCRVIEIGLGGCRVQTRERFLAGILVRVELTFRIRGIAMRFSGVTEWTDDRHVAGIRFADVPARRLQELDELLQEVAEENAAKAEKQARELETPPAALVSRLSKPSPAAASTPAIATVRPTPNLVKAPEFPPKRIEPKPPAQPTTLSRALGALPAPVAQSPRPASAKPTRRERRTQSRQAVDTSAVIHLINVAARVHGRILDLSIGGCRIRTDEHFPVGIYTRVETEFQLEGLPFRLAGVTQAIHDRRHVGIRFLDMSERKREQVTQLMDEIEELRERQKQAGATGASEAIQA
jgi:hypothetical protein